MLRNRPLAPPAPADHGIASTRTTHTRHHRPLVVIPKGPAAHAVEAPEVLTTKPRLLDDLLRLSTHRLSAFLAEAAVLVLVLGLLERFLTAHHIELRWTALILGISATLLASSVLVELTGTRRAGHS